MPLTFGAATTDVVSPSFTNNVGANGTGFVFGMWFYPTSLTADRCLLTPVSTNRLFSYSIRIGTTTSSLRLGSNTSTTAGVWSAVADTAVFPSGITVNKWWFLAGLMSAATGPTIAWRMWLGDSETAPRPMTITQTTAPAGIPIGGAGLYVGNDTTTSPTSAFQGDIGQIQWISGQTGILTPLPIATPGTITTDEENLIAQTYVQPWWLGQHCSHYPRYGGSFVDWLVCEFNNAATYLTVAVGPITRLVATTSGATASLQTEPRGSDIAMNVRLPLVRR